MIPQPSDWKPNVVSGAGYDLSAGEGRRIWEASKGRNGGAEPIPAWMFNLAWDRLRSFGSLSNKELCDDMRVHRSAGVLAILARIPGVEAAPGRKAEIRWR